MHIQVQIGHDYGDADPTVENREGEISSMIVTSYDVEERSRQRHHIGPPDESGRKPITISVLTFESKGGS